MDLLHALSKHSSMNKEVSITEAKTQLSRLLRQVLAGEEFTITNRGVPVARLVPVSTSKPKWRG